MIFKRREPERWSSKLRNLLWPRMGWKRTLRYFKYRLIRLQDSPSKISRGIASGVAISFIPLPGTHFIHAFVLAWFLQGNILASLAATWVGNPWTFPIMWYFAYVTGVGLFRAFGWETSDLPAHFTWDDLWHALTTDPYPLILPWMLGGYLICALTWPITYYLVHPLIAKAQHARHERWRRKHPHYKPGHHP